MERLPTIILYISPIIAVLSIIFLLHTEILLEMSLSFATTTNQSAPSSTQSLLNSPNTTVAANTSAMENATDIFGITKIYPTKEGAREWFLNMSHPTNSSNFSITDNVNLSKVSDSSWRINTTHVRMIVNTSDNQENWNNTEITGYVRLSFPNSSQVSLNRTTTDSEISNQSSISDDESEGVEIDDLVFISRSGRHSSDVPCDGTGYIGGLHTDGSVGWKKEIWHTGGYTDERARNTIADSFLNTWIGWKIVVYTIEIDNETRGVKLESYIDESNTNNWTKVTEFIDGGGWYANTNDDEFFAAGCDKARDHILTDARPNIIFRTDNLVLDFKNLSVREIQPPPFDANANWTRILKLDSF